MKNRILNARESPKELEIIHQENPKGFQQAFHEVFIQYPDSVILQVWNERLSYITKGENQQEGNAWFFKNIILIVLLSLAAGTLLRLPIGNYETIDPSWFYPRNLGGIFIVPLMIYFFLQRPQSRKSAFVILGIVIGSLLFLNFLPYEYNGSPYEFYRKFRRFADAITVAELHIPLLLWLTLGAVFTGKNWRDSSIRMGFLRYNGEVIIYATIILIGGMILTGITMGLLSLIERNYELSEWYTENIIPYGLAAILLVATFLIDKVIGRQVNIAPTLARVFAPLFLITVFAYLIIMAVYQQSPYNDREYLVTFNLLLILVLGLLIFSIAERSPKTAVGINDYINIGLAFTTLIIDSIALSATLFRLTNDIYGITPNRIAILGINILIFGHLVGILYHYTRFILKKDEFLKLENWIAKYLPLYAVWAISVSLALPLIFWYK
jgi:hypothetical protein